MSEKKLSERIEKKTITIHGFKASAFEISNGATEAEAIFEYLDGSDVPRAFQKTLRSHTHRYHIKRRELAYQVESLGREMATCLGKIESNFRLNEYGEVQTLGATIDRMCGELAVLERSIEDLAEIIEDLYSTDGFPVSAEVIRNLAITGVPK